METQRRELAGSRTNVSSYMQCGVQAGADIAQSKFETPIAGVATRKKGIIGRGKHPWLTISFQVTST